MKRILLLLIALLAVILLATACSADSPQEEMQTDDAEAADTGFVPLELMEDTSVLAETWETFETMGLSFQYAPDYSVVADTTVANTTSMGHLRAFGSFGQVNIMATAGLEQLPTTPDNINEMVELATALVGGYEVLEENDLLIHGTLWNHITIQYHFGGEELFHTMLFTTVDGIVYVLTYAASLDQMEALRDDRNILVSSLWIDPDFIVAEDASASFYERRDEPLMQFAYRFMTAKTGDAVPDDFFETFDSIDFFGETMPFFVYEDVTYFVVTNEMPRPDTEETHTNLAVVREDLLFGGINTNFSPVQPGVSIEIPSDAIIGRTQAMVDLFSDLLPDFNNELVTAEEFNTVEGMAGPFSMFQPSNYAVREDGFSQVTWKITGEAITIDFTVLVLIYEGDDLIAAMFVPGNVMS